MKVVGYVRVSTEEQATQGVSLQAQEAKLRQYCDLYGHDLAEVVIDAGQSAKTLNRPGLAKVLASLEAGEVEGVVILKLDRLTRTIGGHTNAQGIPQESEAANLQIDPGRRTFTAQRLARAHP